MTKQNLSSHFTPLPLPWPQPQMGFKAEKKIKGIQVLDFRKQIILWAKYTLVGEKKSLNVLLKEFNKYKY